MKKRMAALFAGLVCFPALLAGCTQEEAPAQSECFVMNTVVTQKVYGREKEEAAAGVEELLYALEEKLSLYREGSDIDRINSSAGIAPVEVDEYTFELIATARRYSELSGGYFDITIAPVAMLWGITSDHPAVPGQAELESALKLVGWEKLILDEEARTVYLSEPGMAIDLGGVAKGYIAGRIREEYGKWKVDAALVSIGGNIDALGKKPDGTQFVLGIRDPEGSAGSLLGRLPVENRIVATSGGYERFFEQDGKRFHHILDPKTGYPAESDLLSVSVIAEDGGLADYLSTTLFMAGSAYMGEYLNRDGFDVIVVDNRRRVYVSDRIRDDFELLNTGDYVLVPAEGEGV